MNKAGLRHIWRELGIPTDYIEARGLPLQPEADEGTLVTLATAVDSPVVRLLPLAAAAWSRLQSAAHGADLTVIPLSGFRSIARQAEIIRTKLADSQPLADILRVIAAPGCSEHHTGRALDVGVPGGPLLTESFADTAAFAWLEAHAATFGFTLSYPRSNAHGIAYEPWHWCWRP